MTRVFNMNIFPTKRLLRSVPVLFFAMLLFSSCLKDNDQNYVSIEAAVTTIQASPSALTYDFYTDVRKVNTQSVLRYGHQLYYQLYYSGNRRFGLTLGGSNQLVADTVLSLTSDQAYTLFIADTSEHVGFLLLNDGHLTQAPEGKAKIRFANLSPGSPELDFGEKDADSLLASAKAFKAYSDFKEVNAGNITLFVRRTADNTVLKEFTFDAKSGKLYTIWTKGFIGGENPEYPFRSDTIDHRKNAGFTD